MLDEAPGRYRIGVTATNACGTSSNVTRLINVACQNLMAFSVSPNPAKGVITIAAKTSTAKLGNLAKRHITHIKIYDQQQLLRRQQKFASVAQAGINTSGLKPGIYWIEIIGKGFSEKQKLMIEQ